MTNNGSFRQSVPSVCACVTVVSTVGTELLRAKLSALVGTERVCQIMVVSASQYRACVLLV